MVTGASDAVKGRVSSYTDKTGKITKPIKYDAKTGKLVAKGKLASLVLRLKAAVTGRSAEKLARHTVDKALASYAKKTSGTAGKTEWLAKYKGQVGDESSLDQALQDIGGSKDAAAIDSQDPFLAQVEAPGYAAIGGKRVKVTVMDDNEPTHQSLQDIHDQLQARRAKRAADKAANPIKETAAEKAELYADPQQVLSDKHAQRADLEGFDSTENPLYGTTESPDPASEPIYAEAAPVQADKVSESEAAPSQETAQAAEENIFETVKFAPKPAKGGARAAAEIVGKQPKQAAKPALPPKTKARPGVAAKPAAAARAKAGGPPPLPKKPTKTN